MRNRVLKQVHEHLLREVLTVVLRTTMCSMSRRPSAWAGKTSRWDIACALVFGASAGAEAAWLASDTDRFLDAVVAAAIMTGLLFRSRLPVLCASLLSVGLALKLLITGPADAFVPLLAVVLVSFSVTRYGDRRDGLVGSTLLTSCVIFAMSGDPSDAPSDILSTVLLFVIVPAALGAVVGKGQRRSDAAQVAARRLALEAKNAVGQERRRIARELHDLVSHAVTVIAVQAESAQTVLDHDPDSTRRSLSAIADISREALSELHRLLELLHEDTAPDTTTLGLHRVPSLIEGVRAAGLQVLLTERGEGILSELVDACLFRVVQESLTNALRHAPNGCVEVRIERSDDEVSVTVLTVGPRRKTTFTGTGSGLIGLRERVTELGGKIQFTDEPELFVVQTQFTRSVGERR
jgi:signal transduction histidine kinase